MGLAGCLAVLVVIWNELHLDVDIERFRIYSQSSFGGRLPFSDGDFTVGIAASAAILGALLGFWQTLLESVSGTWPFLMHRPLTRRGMLLKKLASGAVLLAAATGLPVLLYALWVATIGSRTVPFRWWMTAETWVLWFTSFGVYLAAFLVGIREARWYVSRLWPLVPAVGLALILPELTRFAGLTTWLAVSVLLDVGLLGAIAHAARDRDWA
jgi:hypothetical protein